MQTYPGEALRGIMFHHWKSVISWWYTRGIYVGHHAQCPLVLRFLDALLVLRMFVRGHQYPSAWLSKPYEYGGGPALLGVSLGHRNAMGGERKMKLRSVKLYLVAEPKAVAA